MRSISGSIGFSYVITRRQRFMSLLICAALIFTLLFSVAYLAQTADHGCNHDHCPVCTCIEMCRTNLSSIALIGVSIIAALLLPQDKKGIKAACQLENSPLWTLIGQKVRLNN